MRATQITDNDVVKLMASLRGKEASLLRVDVAENEIGAPSAIALVGALADTKIEGISMERCDIGDEGAAAFAAHLASPNSQLKDLYLSANNISHVGVVKIAKALETNTLLHSLDMQRNSVRNKGARALAEMIQKNKVLESLWLDAAGIDHRGMQTLAEAAQVNDQLTTLELMGNVMNINTLHDKVLTKLAKKLHKNKQQGKTEV